MKKNLLIGTGVFAVVIALVVSLYSANVSQAGPKLSHEEVKSLVSSQYPGTIMELELDREDKRPVYEIEILNDETEYELEVDANTGEILKLKERRVAYPLAEKDDDDDADDRKDKKEDKEKNKESNVAKKEEKNNSNSSNNTKIVVQEPKDEVKKQVKQTQPKQQQQPKKVEKKEQPKQQVQKKQQTQKKEQKQEKKQTVISRQQAINIALSKFSGKVEDVELDDDDGRLIYEIEIENGDKEAEFEIDAITGKILSIEYDD